MKLTIITNIISCLFVGFLSLNFKMNNVPTMKSMPSKTHLNAYAEITKLKRKTTGSIIVIEVIGSP